jgi:putative spermidine/putrescine transport system substrate-binding protein
LVGKHAELGIDMKPHMPTDPANAKTVLQFDYVWWADHRAEMDERFNAWLAQ